MAYAYGSWAGGSGVGGMRVGIELAAPSTTITSRYRAQTGSNSINDTQTLKRTGALTGSTEYKFNTSGTPPLSKDIGSWTRTGTRGTSYSFGASVSGVYSGNNPSVSGVSITVPALKPSGLAKPTASVTGVGQVTAVLGSAPSSNGSSITRYRARANGGSWVYSTSRTIVLTGLGNGTLVTVEFQAENGVGWSASSAKSSSVTTWAVPAKPVKPTVSAITSVGATAKIASAPANNGSGILEYQFDVFGYSVWSSGTSLSKVFTGMPANAVSKVRVRARNAVGWGPYSDYSAEFRTKPLKPLAQSVPVITRVSDTEQTISIAFKASSTAPLTHLAILRAHWTGSAWSSPAQIAKPAKVATANGTLVTSDKTTAANGAYRYYVVGVNAGGEGDRTAASGVIYTKPGKPTGLKASKKANQITLSGVGGASAAAQSSTFRHQYQDSIGGAEYVAAGSATSGKDPSQTFTVDQSKTHRLRAQAYVASGGSASVTLYSDWSDPTETIQLLTAPLAPAVSVVRAVQDRDVDVAVSVAHRPVDSTEQEGVKVQYRLGSGAWTEIVGTTEAVVVIPALGESGDLQVTAQTRGELATYGPTSSVVTVVLGAVPVVSITDPSELKLDSVPRLEWETFAADGAEQVAWEARWWLLSPESGEWVQVQGSRKSVEATKADLEVVFPFALVWGRDYRGEVRATVSSGLVSEWASIDTFTDFPLPFPAGFDGQWVRDTGRTELQIVLDTEDPDRVDVASVTVERRIGWDDTADFVVIGDGIDPAAIFTDPLPALGRNVYRAVTHTEDGAADVGPEFEMVVTPRDVAGYVYLNDGADPFRVVKVRDNAAVSGTLGRQKDRRLYRKSEWPTEVGTRRRHDDRQVQFTLGPDTADRFELEAFIMDAVAPVCWRDPLGRRDFVSVGDMTYGHDRTRTTGSIQVVKVGENTGNG